MANHPHIEETIEETYAGFRARLDAEDKAGCVMFALSVLQSAVLDIPTFYERIVAPAAREQRCTMRQRALCIWEEHVRTSILRTVIECCYPELTKVRRLNGDPRTKGSALIVCPPEEYHELGARMVTDLFTLCGFEVTFVGANTPQQDILTAVTVVHPVLVGISITSPYNLIAARRTIQQLIALRTDTGGTFRIVAGGQALKNDTCRATSWGVDLLAQSYDDIRRISEETPWPSR